MNDPAKEKSLIGRPPPLSIVSLDDDADFREFGSNTGRLLSNDEVWDRYSGQPLMTNVPVDVVPRARPPHAAPGG